MTLDDYYLEGRRFWLKLREKGGLPGGNTFRKVPGVTEGLQQPRMRCRSVGDITPHSRAKFNDAGDKAQGATLQLADSYDRSMSA